MAKSLKNLRASLAVSLVLLNSTAAGAETINRAPNFEIFQHSEELRNHFGSAGADKLCWPSSLAHRMIYFQRYRNPAYPRLRLQATSAADVAYFARACGTSMAGGTSQKNKIPCILNFFHESDYSGKAFVIGSAATDFPRHRAVVPADLLEPLRKDMGVILHVGWLRYDFARHAWSEKGSHSLNVYGFDYHAEWGEKRITLFVANPAVNYSSRAPGHKYDTIELTQLTRQPGVSYPRGTGMVVSGPGFNQKDRLAVLDDIFVFSPE